MTVEETIRKIVYKHFLRKRECKVQSILFMLSVIQRRQLKKNSVYETQTNTRIGSAPIYYDLPVSFTAFFRSEALRMLLAWDYKKIIYDLISENIIYSVVWGIAHPDSHCPTKIKLTHSMLKEEIKVDRTEKYFKQSLNNYKKRFLFKSWSEENHIEADQLIQYTIKLPKGRGMGKVCFEAWKNYISKTPKNKDVMYQQFKNSIWKNQLSSIKRWNRVSLEERKEMIVVDREGRMHSIFTYTSKLFRTHIMRGGECRNFYDIDSVCCHPSMLIQFFVDQGYIPECQIKLLKWFKALNDGDLYKPIQDVLKVTRERAKVLVMIMINGDMSPWLYNDLRKVYPDMVNYVYEFKRRQPKWSEEYDCAGWKVLGSILRRSEAKLFHGALIYHLNSVNPHTRYIVIHDGIMIENHRMSKSDITKVKSDRHFMNEKMKEHEQLVPLSSVAKLIIQNIGEWARVKSVFLTQKRFKDETVYMSSQFDIDYYGSTYIRKSKSTVIDIFKGDIIKRLMEQTVMMRWKDGLKYVKKIWNPKPLLNFADDLSVEQLELKI